MVSIPGILILEYLRNYEYNDEKGEIMMFKEMAKLMQDKEVQRCLSILVEDGILLSIQRDIIQNAIEITFRIVGDQAQEQYHLTMLPDSVQDLSAGVDLRVDGEYLYIQYLVAKGYSVYWKGNMFV